MGHQKLQNIKPIIHPKLYINSPGDKYEQEADAMANKVMRMPSIESKGMASSSSLIGASIQRKCASCEEEQKRKQIMRKEAGNFSGIQVSNSFSSSLNASKGAGSTLPKSTKSFMENAFSTDFSNVKIHNDSQAHQMSQSINAKAFTHGHDIYFGSGQFNPNSYSGKSLLAHELTHTLQQWGVINKDTLQRQDIEEISTPVPDDFVVNHDRRDRVTSATGVIAGVNITIRPDRRGRVPRGSSGETQQTFSVRLPRAIYTRGRRPTVRSIVPARISTSIRTSYGRRATTRGDSAYGRGTTTSDRSAGDTSLRFHEGSHGTRVLDFIRTNPLPLFSGTVGMSRTQFTIALRTYGAALRTYGNQIGEASLQDVDCVGVRADFC